MEGAHLASIHSDEETRAIFAHIHEATKHTPFHPTNVWIGASKLRAGNTWEWSDGTAWDFAKLDGSVQPDTENNCLAIKWDWHGQWVDLPCFKIGLRKPFICKMKNIKSRKRHKKK